jgi:pimeloyl-ACP methyl ester carboxylesterase
MFTLGIALPLHRERTKDMPSFEHHGARIYYEEFGRGFPILTFAPAGLQSTIEVWSQPMAPIDPTTEFGGSFRVVAMDQRNAGGRSHAPIGAGDGWDDYTADHLALLDRLGIDKCHLYGQCIGGSFILNLLKKAPERVACAVLAQPIGRVAPALPSRPPRFDAWAQSLQDHPEATREVLDAFYRNLYAPGFVYCVDRAFVAKVETPCLLLAGNDEAHPYPISEELSRLLPHCEFIPEWKTGAALDAARVRVKEFLLQHTPAHG